MDDNEIIALFFSRSEQAIDALSDKYGKLCQIIAGNILGNQLDAEECVNDTYLAAWNSIPPHKPSILSTYLGKITRRISIDMYRRKNRTKRRASEYTLSLTELDDCLSNGGTPEESMEVKVLADAINTFLRSLSKDERNLFVGRYYFLDSLKEAAKYCGMSVGKAKSMLFRTRCNLKAYLQKE